MDKTFLWIVIFLLVAIILFLLFLIKKKRPPEWSSAGSVSSSYSPTASPPINSSSIFSIFDNAFEVFYETLKAGKESLPKDTYRDMEAFTFLYTVATYYIAQLREPLRDRTMTDFHSKIKKAYPLYINHFFEQRNEFYCDFIGSKSPIARWYGEPVPDVPEIKMFFAFGDILVDPSLRENYESPDVLITSIFSQLESIKVFNSLQNPYLSYCRALKAYHG